MTDPRRTPLRTLVGFAAALREAGLTVGTGQEVTFARAAARLGTGDRDDLYWAGRACLVNRAEDVATYDRVFAGWFGAGVGLTLGGAPPPGLDAAAARAQAPVLRSERPGDRGGLASAWEALRDKDFAACSAEELATIARLLDRLAVTVPRRPARRSDRAPRGRRPDLRRALRDAVWEQAHPARLRRRRPRTRPRPLVFVLDVSGSMAAYSRVLLQLAWAAQRAAERVEVFCFGTRLTRVTGALGRRDPDAGLAEAAREVVDWDGGTRIGESLRTYLRDHARRSGVRGAVVVICSDGLERGDPAVLAAALARLRRLSHRVLWVTPLTADPAYEPVTRGMRAALPHVDALVAGHSLDSLAALAGVLSEWPDRGMDRRSRRA